MIPFRDVEFGNNIREKPLKILDNSVLLEMLLSFSVRLIFSPFKGLIVKRGVIVFQNVLSSVTFLCSDCFNMIFL